MAFHGITLRPLRRIAIAIFPAVMDFGHYPAMDMNAIPNFDTGVRQRHRADLRFPHRHASPYAFFGGGGSPNVTFDGPKT